MLPHLADSGMIIHGNLVRKRQVGQVEDARLGAALIEQAASSVASRE